MGYALPAEELSGSMEKGTVIGLQGTALLVRTQRGMTRAERAAGCLLTPQGGDSVLVAFLPDGEAWVTCVLARSEGEAELLLPEQTALRGVGLTLECEEALVVSRVFSLEGALVSLKGGLLFQGFSAIQTAARRLCEGIARKRGRYGDLSEHTAGLEERSAGRMRIASETSYRLRAENADVRAKTQLDLDAERIKVG